MSRPFIVINVDQRSPEWLAARLGRLTGSKAADMLATVKSGEAAARRNLRAQLVLERITGRATEFNATAAMQMGTDREPEAYARYQAESGNELTTTGFLQHTEFMAGCSLDGSVGDFEGIVEFKCPQPANHLEFLKTGKIKHEYQKQILHNLWISGAGWCDFASYNPDFPSGLQFRMLRVERDDWGVAQYEQQALEFLSEVDMEVRLIERMAA